MLEQLQGNHMGIEKTRLLGRKLVSWFNMYADIEYCEAVCCIPGVPTDATTRKSITL